MNKKKPNKETIKAINDAVKGKNIIGPFKTIDDLKAALKN